MYSFATTIDVWRGVRWLTKRDNGLMRHKAAIYAALQRCANSITVEQYEESLESLKDMPIWSSSQKLRRYFHAFWEQKPEVK